MQSAKSYTLLKACIFFRMQISALRKKNKVLEERCKTKDNAHISPSHKGSDDGNEFGILKQSEEALTEPSTTNFQVVQFLNLYMFL